MALTSRPVEMDTSEVRAIAALSARLHLPVHEVQRVYVKEFDRLKSQARIHNFLAVLALNSTHTVLRSGRKLAPSGRNHSR